MGGSSCAVTISWTSMTLSSGGGRRLDGLHLRHRTPAASLAGLVQTQFWRGPGGLDRPAGGTLGGGHTWLDGMARGGVAAGLRHLWLGISLTYMDLSSFTIFDFSKLTRFAASLVHHLKLTGQLAKLRFCFDNGCQNKDLCLFRTLLWFGSRLVH